MGSVKISQYPFQALDIPAAMVLSVADAQGKVPIDSSWNSALPLLTLECRLPAVLE